MIIVIKFDEDYNIWMSSLCIFHYPPVISSFISTPLWNTFILCLSFIVRDQVSHPYETT
jgi:hypothetical protein